MKAWTVVIGVLLSACGATEGSTLTNDELDVVVVGSGRVASGGGFIDCPGFCSHTYPSNRTSDDDVTIQLTATPAAGWAFSSWSLNCGGQGLTITVTLVPNDKVTCIATFTAAAAPDLSGTWTLYDNATTVHSPSETTTIAPFTGTAFTGTNNVAGTVRDITGTYVGTAVNWTRWADINHTQCHEKETLTADLNANPKTMNGNIVDCTGGLGRVVLWKHN